jgi:hypothetical protein
LGATFAIPAGLSVVEGNDIPYQPWAAARQRENYDNWLARDPEVKCYLPGLPRATYMPYPFQILQTGNNDILMAYEYASASRVIKMGKAEPPPVDTWMGQSVGRWEGDTLVVDVTGFNDQTWFDRAGNFHSEALHVVERFTARRERPAPGVQVRGVRRGNDVRASAQEDRQRKVVRRRTSAVAVIGFAQWGADS